MLDLASSEINAEINVEVGSEINGEVASETRSIDREQDRCDREHVSHIRQFCREIPASVRIIAVTKQVSVGLMRSAYEAGIRDFGENRVQEAIQKQQELQDLKDIRWHFIGHLQSNKARMVVQHFDWIQSVDTLALAERIDRLAQAEGKIIQVCLQVKLRPDDTKSGWSPGDLRRSMPQLTKLPALQIQGLMVIPPASLNPEDLSICFKEAALLVQELQLAQLSMGMSQDYPMAIQCGATMIRPGRVLFGLRT